MLTTLQNLPVIGPIIQNVKMLLICAAVLIVSNAGTGLFMYVKGHNAAAAKCKINSIIRERDEARRDRDNAVATSRFVNSKLKELQDSQEKRDAQDVDAAAKLKPVDGCVVPDDAPDRVRKHRPRLQAPASRG